MGVRRKAILALVVAAVVPIGFYLAMLDRRVSWTSPDGRYEIAVYAEPMLFAMPGQGGDAAGWVVLRRHRGFLPVRIERVDMVNLVEPPAWRADAVSLKLIADWPLPR